MTSDIFSFDRTAVSILRYIKHHPGKTLSEIFQMKKFRDKIDAANTAVNVFFRLKELYEEGYISFNPNLELASMSFMNNSANSAAQETLYITPKGNKFLEDRFDRYWMWIIPTSISVLALICSLLTFLFSFHG